jgi:hypothetical protein
MRGNITTPPVITTICTAKLILFDPSPRKGMIREISIQREHCGNYAPPSIDMDRD